MTRHRAVAVRALTISFTATLGFFGFAQVPVFSQGTTPVSQNLRARAARDGHVRVLVQLRLPGGAHVAEGRLSADAAAAQRRNIGAAADRVWSRLPPPERRLIHRFASVPFVALEVGPKALATLESAPDVVRVTEDEILRPTLAESVPLIQGDQAWGAGYDGAGTTIAVLDTGIESSHPFLSGKVIEEACFNSTTTGVSQSNCPNGLDEQFGPGAAVPCTLSDCFHGTHVAGIAAGNGATASQPFSGVAKGARLMAVQVFSRITDPGSCPSGAGAPCVGAFTSDIIAGLERVYTLAPSLNVVSVNLSVGGTTSASACDDQPYKPAIDNLRSIGVATVIAAGNDASGTMISTPACISSAVSVGSVDKSDQVSFFSNVAPFMSLLAPGDMINSSVLGGGFDLASGTSMAAPHVAGAWAILRQAVPSGDVTTILNALRQTGKPITDDRLFFGAGAVVPRVNIFEAIASLVPVSSPLPVLTSVTPARLRAGTSPVTITLNGSAFNVFSVARWNGAPRPTVFVSSTQLNAEILPADLAAGPSGQLSVATPPPGGGTTASVTVPIDPPPSLTVNATSVAPAARVTMTLANGFGGGGDWLALAAVGSPNASYVNFTYVGANVFERTWTVTMPSTPGSYEFRLFLNGNYTRVATSPTVVVDTAINPVPAIGSLSPASTAAKGPAFTLTVNGTGFVSSSVVRWNGASRPTTFINATQLQAAIGASDIASPATALVTVVSPAPGGGTSAAASFTVNPAPALSVNATSVTVGTSVTVTLTNGLGGGGDWLSFAPATAPNSSYISFIYVGAGVTTRTWTVTPSTPGTYEFRLLLNNGFTRAATSPAVTVSSDGSVSLTSLSPNRAFVGTGAFTLTVNGTGFVSASTVNWNGTPRSTTFVNSTQLRASITAADIATPGTAQVTVVSPAPAGTSSALPFTIALAPTLTVSATTVAPGGSVTVTLTNGTGAQYDWLSFVQSSAPNSSYVTFTYVGTGVTTRTWTVTAPATPGTYEFRLFLNNGYTRVATSPTVTVQ